MNKIVSYNCPYCDAINSVILNEYDECFCIKCGEGPIGKHNRFNMKPKFVYPKKKNNKELEDGYGNV